MTKKLLATFDGKIIRPDEPLPIPPNSRVTVIVEYPESKQTNSGSFLKTARELKLSGPSDWSSRLEEYLYDQETRKDG